MGMILTGNGDSFLQMIAVLCVFVCVLAVTAFTTKWIAGYQKQQSINCNIEVLETTRICNNKYIQLVRIGETYMAIAVCKDTVTMLREIPQEQISRMPGSNGGTGFKELLDKVMKKDIINNSGDVNEPKE